MGHRNSSAQRQGADSFCFDANGIARTAAEPSPANIEPRGILSFVRTIATADSSLCDRRVRKSADSNAESPATPLGMTTFTGSGTGRGAVWLLLVAIRFYQSVFSPVMPVGCKFYPSCSRYAAEAIARHGAKRGLGLAVARLWRCRPFTKGGVDLVPDVGEEHDGAGAGMSRVHS